MNSTAIYRSSVTSSIAQNDSRNDTNVSISTCRQVYSERHCREAEIYIAIEWYVIRITLGLAVFGVLEQILSIAALRYMKNIRPMHKFILSMAVAELAFLINVLAQQSLHVAQKYPHNCWDSIFLTLDHLFISATELSILAMVIDQYLAICHPLRYQVLISGFTVSGMIIAAWSLSIITSLWQFFSIETYRKVDHNLIICMEGLVDKKWWKIFKNDSVTAHLHVVILMLGLLVIICLYVNIFYVAWRSFGSNIKSGRRSSGRSSGEADIKQRVKTAFTAFLIFMTLLVFWAPYWAIRVAAMNSHFEGRLPFWVTVLVYHVVNCINPLVDPIIYGVRMKEIRDGYRRMFRAFCSTMHWTQNCHGWLELKRNSGASSGSRPSTTGTSTISSTHDEQVEMLDK